MTYVSQARNSARLNHGVSTSIFWVGAETDRQRVDECDFKWKKRAAKSYIASIPPFCPGMRFWKSPLQRPYSIADTVSQERERAEQTCRVALNILFPQKKKDSDEGGSPKCDGEPLYTSYHASKPHGSKEHGEPRVDFFSDSDRICTRYRIPGLQHRCW